MGDYTYDVFVSYRKGRRIGTDGVERLSAEGQWVQEVFLPELERWMEQSRPSTRLWADTKLRGGGRWPDDIRAALRGSRCMLAVWSAPYFESEWCRSEWHTMRARAERDRTLGRPVGTYVFPVGFWDGSAFDDEAKDTTESADLRPYSHLIGAEREVPCDTFREFRKCMQVLCEELAAVIDATPPYDPDWPECEMPARSADPMPLASLR